MKLKNKLALVTGGTRGIGKSITLKLLEEGSTVIATYNKDQDSANTLQQDVKNKGFNNSLEIFSMDVIKRDSIKNLMQTIINTHKRIDILVNNAGVNKPTDFDQISDDDWDWVLNVNLRGPFICTQEALDLLKASASASIINISSVSGQYGGPRTAHYAASKAGLISLSQVMARFLAEYNIRSNTIAVGLIESEMAATGLASPLVSSLAKSILLKRLGSKDEVADLVSFLASDESSYITAQTINLNGGLYF
jgi:3-oxoacyl-[acyl-carrier protein] reductase